MICTFFGHRETPYGVEPRIKEILTRLIEKSDFVVTYVSREVGGAAKFKSLAEKKGKTVINIEI